MVKIDDRRAMRRKWDQPGVVGEKDSWKESKINEYLHEWSEASVGETTFCLSDISQGNSEIGTFYEHA